jgi:hypothetical protein
MKSTRFQYSTTLAGLGTSLHRTVETFNFHNRVVVKVTFNEASVGEGGYSNLSTCEAFEAAVNKGVGFQPDISLE